MKERDENKEYNCLQNIMYAFGNIWKWNKKTAGIYGAADSI